MSALSLAAPLRWHDDAELLGVQVRACFFDPAEVDARGTVVERHLPIFEVARPRLCGVEDKRSVYSVGDLWAQPYVVYEHGNGLLCLTHRHTFRLLVERER